MNHPRAAQVALEPLERKKAELVASGAWCEAWAVLLPMTTKGWDSKTKLLVQAVAAKDVLAPGRKPTPMDISESIQRASSLVVGAKLRPATDFARTEVGRRALAATGILKGCTVERPWPFSEFERNFAEITSNLAGLLFKEVFRGMVRQERNKVLVAPPALASESARARLRTPVGGSSPLADLFRRGYCVVDGCLDAAESRALYDHYSTQLRTGVLSHVSKDACNVGCASALLPVRDDERRAQFGAEPPAVKKAFELMAGLADDVDAAAGGLELMVPGNVMVAVYPPDGSKYVPHSDWYSHETYNYRFLSCLLYFNPDWTEDDGGHLRMHLDRRPKHAPADGEPGALTDLLPAPGRLVLFFARTVTHEVLPAKLRERWAYTLWVERLPKGPPPKRKPRPEGPAYDPAGERVG